MSYCTVPIKQSSSIAKSEKLSRQINNITGTSFLRQTTEHFVNNFFRETTAGEIVFGQRSAARALASCLVRVFVSAQHHIQTQLKFAAYRLTALNRVNGNSFFLFY